MIRSTRTTVLVATFVAVSITACGSDSPTSPARQIDLTSVFSDIAAGSAGSYAGAGAFVTLGASAPLVPSDCAYSASLRGFACPSRTASGLTVSGSYFLLDADGLALTVADPNRAAAIRVISDIHGTTGLTNQPNVTVSTSTAQHSDMTISGLQGTTRTLNGTTTGHIDATFTSPVAEHDITDLTIKTIDLVLPSASAANRYPTSGTISVHSTGSSSVNSGEPMTFTTNEVLTFNGTSIVTMTVTSGSMTKVCTFDVRQTAPPTCQ